MASASTLDRLRLSTALTASVFRDLAARLQASHATRWRWGLKGTQRLLLAPPDLRTPDPALTPDIYAGRFLLAGQLLETAGRSPFEAPAPSNAFFEALHGFTWLRHLRASDNETARALARTLVADWLATYGNYRRDAWQARITARRIISWLSHSPLILTGADRTFFRRVLRSLTQQTRYLQAMSHNVSDPAVRLTCTIALAYAGLTFQGWGLQLRRASRWLEEELSKQILLDGGHVGRNPGTIVELLLDLLPLRQCYIARDMTVPAELSKAIDRMLPMLRFFRHTDGTLAHFNGMGVTRPDVLAALLAYDETRGEPIGNAVPSGFQRLASGQTVVVADTGKPPPLPASAHAHAGTLSFELSTATGRLITNCGTPVRGAATWERAARSTAAHSTAVLNDTSSARFAGPGWASAKLGRVIVAGPRTVDVTREDTPNGAGFDASHDGYAETFNIVHRRRLRLSPDGTRLDGEDVFQAARTASRPQDTAFAIRFHLAPGVSLSESRNPGRVVLARSGESWIFDAAGAAIAIEESVYLSALNGPRQTEQIVLYGTCVMDAPITWRLTLAAAGPGEDPPLDSDGESFLLPF